MLSSYIQELNRMIEAQAPQPRAQSLRQKVQDWYASLPVVSRHDRKFSMSEIESAVGVPGRILGPLLLDMQWQRSRLWTPPSGPYVRFWVAPAG